jgi:hypothetical protein
MTTATVIETAVFVVGVVPARTAPTSLPVRRAAVPTTNA